MESQLETYDEIMKYRDKVEEELLDVMARTLAEMGK